MTNKPFKSWEDIQEMCQSNTSWSSRKTKKFLEIVEISYLNRKKDLKDYADEIGITPNGLYKNCERIIQVSPSYCVYARIVFEVCNILREDCTYQAKEIADKLDMDTYHFSKFFKTHTGQTFRSFRKEFSK